jgi:NAD(P)-dependent dehydrogenase (short-subunit alcohol dehydrogenase family)
VIYGAGGGIGGAIARTFALERHGLLTRRHLPPAEIVAKEIDAGVAEAVQGRGGRALLVPTDVNDPASVERLVTRRVCSELSPRTQTHQLSRTSIGATT